MSSSSRCVDADRRAWLAAAALCALGASAHAQGAVPPEVRAAWPQATLRGQGRLRFIGMAIYDARLWAPAPIEAPDWWRRPLALELEYARRLVGRRIAERSLEEMRRQHEIAGDTAAGWLDAMTRLFPDVAEGDRLTGLLLPGEGTRFYFNGRPRGEVRDPEFARLFFGIWLSPQTSEPDLRTRLLGLAGPR